MTNLAYIKPSYVILYDDEIIRTVAFNKQPDMQQLRKLTKLLGGNRYIATYLDDALDIAVLLERYR